MKESQNKTVLDWLQSGKELTAYQAAVYMGIFRLSARIYDLKDRGHEITSTMEFDGSKHWSIYALNTKP